MARIIVNGDDLGMNGSCSAAIAGAFELGLITDSTAMANGEYLDEALELARTSGFERSIGIHLNLTEGRPLTEGICSLEAFVTDGCFNKRAVSLSRGLSPEEGLAVYAELTAQVLRLKEAGIAITHADSHHYIHNLPYLAPVFEQVCREQGITKLRLRRDLNRADKARAAEIKAYNDGLRSSGFITTAHFGKLTDIAGAELPDRTEILVHPDLDRDGRLIDRTGVSGGFPTGEPIPDLRAERGAELISYSLL